MSACIVRFFSQFKLSHKLCIIRHKVQEHVQNCSKLCVCFPVPSVSLLTYLTTRKANTEKFKTATTSTRPRIFQTTCRRGTDIIFVQYTGCYVIHHRPTVRTTLPSMQSVLGFFFLGVKRPRRDADHPSPSSAGWRGGLELYPRHPLCLLHVSLYDIHLYIIQSTKLIRCRNSSVDIATRYWLDGPGIESR